MSKIGKGGALRRAKAFAAKVVAGSATVAASGAAMASGGGSAVDTTEIMTLISDTQTKGVALAAAVTIMLFMFAGAKWLRRAK